MKVVSFLNPNHTYFLEISKDRNTNTRQKVQPCHRQNEDIMHPSAIYQQKLGTKEETELQEKHMPFKTKLKKKKTIYFDILNPSN